MGGKQGRAKKITGLMICWLLFIGYLIVLSYFLFFSEYYGRTETTSEYRYNLVLFAEIRRFIKHREVLGTRVVLVNLLGNVLAFVPLGISLPLLTRKNAGFLAVFLQSLFFSALIEFIQLMYRVGSFDVDDIFLNTCGAILGFLLFRTVRRKGKRRGKSA